MTRNKIIVFSTILGCIITICIFTCDFLISKAAQGKLYSDPKTIPFNKVGLLLGTSKYLPNSIINPYYEYRIEAAVSLIKERKVKYLIISGDNSRQDYNEPQLMKDDLIKDGIDSNIIYLDYAGFRTFDSIIRLKEIFGQDSATIISQPFHNERAIYIASTKGIFAIGFNAKDVSSKIGFKTQVREKLARVKVFLDGLTGKKPRYLGSRIIIPG